MERVYDLATTAFDPVRGAGIAIREIDAQQRHIGLLYRDAAPDQASFLHLAWHFDLRCETPKKEYMWVDPAIPAARLSQLAAVCRLVWRANGKGRIPYGFGPPADCLDAKTGEYLFGPAGAGLTCATFVLAAFHRAGLTLVRYETWPISRSGDADWQARIVEALAATPGASAEHVDAVARDAVTTVRFRPEEVAGATTLPAIPVAFADAEERAAQLLARLRERTTP